MNRTSYNNVSTADLQDRRNSVDMLWLDVIEHKLQKELAELQGTSIDEESVGCCEMVDIAAKLQQELDECREQNGRLHAVVRDGQGGVIESWRQRNGEKDDVIIKKNLWIAGMDTEIKKRDATIETLESKITDLLENDKCLNGWLDEYRETVENRDKTIERRGDVIKRQRETIDEVSSKYDKLHIDFCRRGDTISNSKNRMHLYEHGKITQHDVICEINNILQDIDVKYCTCGIYPNTLSKANIYIEELNDRIIEKGLNISDLMSANVDLEKEIAGLEHELSARKGDIKRLKTDRDEWKQSSQDAGRVIKRLDDRKKDSEVLMKVVGVVRDWLDTPLSDRSALNRLEYITKDYLDIPEGFSLDAPEPPIEEEHCITVNVPTTEHVQPIIDELLRGLKQHGAKVKVEFNVPDGVFLELP